MPQEAQEGEGDEKGEEGGEVGIHELSSDEFPVLTQNPAFQCGVIVNCKLSWYKQDSNCY